MEWAADTSNMPACVGVETAEHPVRVYVRANTEYNNHQGILQDISQIGFPHLRKLFLRNNMIDCIETLAQMSLPCLTDIWIGNHIGTQVAIT